MRLSIVTLAVAALPSLAAAQVRQPRRPIVPPPPQTTTAELPPQAPIVSHALAYQYSRWAIDAYSLVATYSAPTGFGNESRSTAAGTGARADYRISPHFSATVDFTSTYLFSPSLTLTGEVGTRYWATSRAAQLRPFIDLRALYLRMSDQFDSPARSTGSATPYGYTTYNRYGQGAGALVAAGFERSISNSLSLTTGLAAMRGAMSTYRLDTSGQAPDRGRYRMTSMRFMLGVQYNRTTMPGPGSAASQSLR